MLPPWAGQQQGTGDVVPRVTQGQGLPSNPAAHPVPAVPAHRPLVIPAWGTEHGAHPMAHRHHVPGALRHPEQTPTFSPLAPEDPLAPCEDTNAPVRTGL